MTLSLTLLDETFTLHRLQPDANIPADILNNPFFSVTRTQEELSLILPESVFIESEISEPGWACFKVNGPLEFNLVGVLAGISSVLAEAGIHLFALSTYDTDYILVKREQVEAAKDALISAGYGIHQRQK